LGEASRSSGWAKPFRGEGPKWSLAGIRARRNERLLATFFTVNNLWMTIVLLRWDLIRIKALSNEL
jgi:hypothetical protein